MSKHWYSRLALIGMVTTVGVTQVYAQEAEDSALAEVVVTARKRDESLQTVPISVNAVSGAELEQRSLETLQDLGQSTPNFNFGQTLNGGSVAGVAFVRGVGQRDAHPAYDPAVGIYVDGVYMGRMYANNLDMLELERVEVLLGPQGTLFGKNTSGGAVNVITKVPNLDQMSGRAQVTVGQRDRFDALAGINLPLVSDRLALRLTGSRLSQDGYGSRLDGEETGDTNRQAARAQLLFKGSDQFSVTLGADWMDFDEHNAAFKLVATNPSVPPLAALNAFTAEKYDDRWLSPSDYFSNGGGPNSARGTVWGTSLTVGVGMPWAVFKSISAYRKLRIHTDVDPDGSPVVVINKFETADQHQFSQELQLTGTATDSRLDWVLGAYYFDESADDTDRFDLLPALFGPTRGFSRHIPIENKSTAFYGQANYGLSDRLSLTAGLRHTKDKKAVEASQFNYLGALAYPTQSGEHDSSTWSPRLGLDYRWTPDLMTYVSVAQGAKNGGFNGRAGRASDFSEFDDETVWTYELGVRSTWLDGRARLNATAFYSRYQDMQLQISGSTTVNGAPAPFSLITNIPRSRIVGGEAELSFSPVRGLTLTGTAGLADGKYTRLPNDPQFTVSRIIDKDAQFSNTPKVAYTLGAAYHTDVTDAWGITGRVDYSHKSRIYYLPENTVNSLQPSYGLVNARLTFEHERSGVSVSVFGTNLTDEHYIVAAFDDANNPNPGLGFATVTMAAPREWGVTLQVKF
jgi:iron complex outermembrane receptor protein